MVGSPNLVRVHQRIDLKICKRETQCQIRAALTAAKKEPLSHLEDEECQIPPLFLFSPIKRITHLLLWAINSGMVSGQSVSPTAALTNFSTQLALGLALYAVLDQQQWHVLLPWSGAYTISKHRILSSARYYSSWLEDNQKETSSAAMKHTLMKNEAVSKTLEFYNFWLTYYQWMCLPFQYWAVHQQNNSPKVPFSHPHCFAKRSTAYHRLLWVLETKDAQLLQLTL